MRFWGGSGVDNSGESTWPARRLPFIVDFGLSILTTLPHELVDGRHATVEVGFRLRYGAIFALLRLLDPQTLFRFCKRIVYRMRCFLVVLRYPSKARHACASLHSRRVTLWGPTLRLVAAAAKTSLGRPSPNYRRSGNHVQTEQSSRLVVLASRSRAVYCESVILVSEHIARTPLTTPTRLVYQYIQIQGDGFRFHSLQFLHRHPIHRSCSDLQLFCSPPSVSSLSIRLHQAQTTQLWTRSLYSSEIFRLLTEVFSLTSSLLRFHHGSHNNEQRPGCD